MSEVSGVATAAASRLGLRAGSVVGEIGYADDVDRDLRAAIEQITGTELLDEDTDEVLDAALIWWRDDDGDLTDALVDAITVLAADGAIWLLTPRTGHDGYVDPSDIGDAADTAGLTQTTNGPSVGGWMMTKLVRARSSGRSRR